MTLHAKKKSPIHNGTLQTFKYSFNIEIGVCKHIEPHLYSAAISCVRYVHNEFNTAHRVNWSWIQAGFDKFTHTYLYIKQILKGFKVTIANRTFLAWRVIWTYAYSPCKYYGSFSFFVFVYLFVRSYFVSLPFSLNVWWKRGVDSFRFHFLMIP